MSDGYDLRTRLYRLGRRRKGVRVRTAIEPSGSLPPGEEIQTGSGPAFRVERVFPLDHRLGPCRLCDLLDFGPGLAAEVARQPSLGEVPLQRLAFLDTETTGLVGGAGTLVFLVGIGTFEGQAFRLRQYFLRQPGEEPGMLAALRHDLEAAAGLVTFNGRVFDVPLLEYRYVLGLRRPMPLAARPQWDLMYPARRLWNRMLPDCSLRTLEQRVLGLRRTEEDVPGELIPGLYLDYLRSGDAAPMSRVFYHNENDVLSMVALAGEILRRHAASDASQLAPPEALAVARWHQAAGRDRTAEAAFRAALVQGDPQTLREALRRYAEHLKRQGRAAEALENWGMWHAMAPEDPTPSLELAKYYEWRAGDFAAAHHWASRALEAVASSPDGWRKARARRSIEHRLARLERKAARSLP